MFNNKKGDVPITVLVILIVVVCAFALVSFFSSTVKAGNVFVGVDILDKLNSQVEQKVFNGENPEGLYIEKRVNRGFLFWQKEIILFSAEYKFRP